MILGIDTGMATCGWARFDTIGRRFVDLGAFATEKSQGKAKTDDQVDRIEIVADVLEMVTRDVEIIVVERMSFASAASIAPIALCMGAVVGLSRAAAARPRVYTVKPQAWQRAVQPSAGKRVDYAEIERSVGEYVRRDRASERSLDSLPSDLRNHALDACAIALMGVYRLHECRPLGGHNSARRET